MMITHLSPAKAIRAVLLLSTAATAVGSTTRNIVHKNEEIAAVSTSQIEEEEHRSLMTVGLNEMECHESLDTNDGSIVCTFRVMPPAATTTAPKLIHDCLFSPSMNNGSGSNFCVTTEISRSTLGEVANHQATANQQQATANNQVVYNPPFAPPPVQQDTIPGSDVYTPQTITLVAPTTPTTPIMTFDATLSSAVIPPAAPAVQEDPIIPSHSGTIQIPTPVNGPNCPSTMPSNGSTCSWVNNNPPKYSTYQCGYLSGDEVPQLPGTFIMVCQCDSTDTFVCAPAVDEIYQGVQSSSF
eukprot:CAMPEP_0170986178 /NCGR_PEP_ID=MMETSP0736-20130129/5931_1 /TAXON_ID=186038 /ORGANISM="Fragilariopsis kerguelensis, Strain L26-C5" /LENGTH=297 /DNA_ID=CAMNT_0011410271 /DNA_START=74 /DNA_END=967 /DNA_ORIENTATION=-